MEVPATVRAPKAVMWTREDCERLERDGLLPESWELVFGEVISKMGQNVPHGIVVFDLIMYLVSVFGPDVILTQCSIDVSPEDNPTSKAEPDLTVLRRSARQLSSNPGPGDVVLVVEVSETTLDYDLRVKSLLYSRAGIPEYWVADAKGRRIHRLTQPQPGGYACHDVFEGDQGVAPVGKDAVLVPRTLFR
jgi:Uma2 family endonuclease